MQKIMKIKRPHTLQRGILYGLRYEFEKESGNGT